jgi:hypothetical protein
MSPTDREAGGKYYNAKMCFAPGMTCQKASIIGYKNTLFALNVGHLSIVVQSA